MLGNDLRLRAIVRTAKKPLPGALARALCEAGERHLSEIKTDSSFWVAFWVWGIWETVFFGTGKQKETAAAWLRRQREACLREERPYPPEDLFFHQHTYNQRTMSRTKEVQRTESPAKTNIFFHGKLGKFSTFLDDDSDLSEIAFPFRFVVVDDGAHRVTGREGLGKDAPKFKSTLAHDGYSTRLRVWKDNDPETIIGEGTWASMSDRLYKMGARYTKVLYVLADFGQGKVLCALHLKGRAFSSWIDATKKIDPCGDVSFAVNKTAMMEGKGEPSLVPVFEVGTISDETKQLATDADEILQAWLETQFESPYVAAPPQPSTSAQSKNPAT